MRKLLIVLGVLVALIGVAGGVVLWLLKDPNRFKPELEALIKDSTGYDVELKGDLGWSLWPPVSLTAADVAFDDGETAYQLGQLALNARLRSLLSSGTLEVQSVVLNDLSMRDKALGDVTQVHLLRLTDFAAGQKAPLYVDGTFVEEGVPDVPFEMDALALFDLDADTLDLSEMRFDYDGITGTCDVQVAHLTRDPIRSHKASRDDLLPLDTFRAMDWVADCLIPQYATESVTFDNVSVKSQNTGARSKTTIAIPEVFGGSINLDANIDTRQALPRWTIKPDAQNLSSQEIMDVVSPKLAWAAPLLVGGEFSMRGNTLEALSKSVTGTAAIAAEQGVIDISLLKASVLQLAQLAGESEEVERWPDMLNYENMQGDWKVNGQTHDLDFAFDNLLIRADGDYDPIADAMNVVASLTINEGGAVEALGINPALYGVPIPMRCTGSTTAPTCGFDAASAQKTLQRIAGNRARQEVDGKLDEVIAEKVPEEYREAAKGLLKGLLGGKKDD